MFQIHHRICNFGAAVAAGRAGSLAGPLFAAALLAGGRGAAQVLLGVLPIALACGGCVGLCISLQAIGGVMTPWKHIAID